MLRSNEASALHRAAWPWTAKTSPGSRRQRAFVNFIWHSRRNQMTIEFTSRRHVVAASRVAFEATVEGKEVWCSVSIDALNNHFGNTGTSSHDLITTFEGNRKTIEDAARRVLQRNGGQSVELETLDFH
ncbi:hypothetical protein CBA19C8_35665 [Paraburkholderia terrae]|nr:hypothetical protein CBA19C8_35665 [Paraburkholderia terrae]